MTISITSISVTDLALYLVGVLLLWTLLNWISRKRAINRTFSSAGIPGPTPTFLTGNFRDYLRNDQKHETLNRWVKQYGPVFGYYQGEVPILVLSNVEDVQEVLVKLGRSFPNRQKAHIIAEPFLSSLLGLRGERWRKSRATLTPPFTAHKMSLSKAADTINEAVGRMILALETKRRSTTTNNSSNPIDVTSLMQCVTLEVISRHAFNATAEEMADLYEETCRLRTITSQFMARQTPNIALQLTAYFPPLQRVAVLAYNLFGGGQLIDHIVEHVNQCVIEYYKMRIQQRFAEADGEKTPPQQKKVNILEYMLEQQEQGNLNELELTGNAIVTLIGGYETSSNALTFTLYLLAKHPEIQEKLRAEIHKANAKTKQPTANYCHFDTNRCELLDRVWYESLRLYPPVVTFVTRELDDNLEADSVRLTKAGVKVTKGMTVQVPVWTLHHSAQHWKDPLVFNPFRTDLPIPGSGLTNYAFLPFGAGPRSCIGAKLADSEARAVLSAILSSYRIELASIVDDEEATDETTGLLKLTCQTIFIRPQRNICLKFMPV